MYRLNDLAAKALLDGLPADERDHLQDVLSTAHDAYLREHADDPAVDVIRLTDYQGPSVAWARVEFLAP